jgi:GABA permease
MSRVLVVANETVGASELLAELRRIEDEKTSTYHVVAPAVAHDHGMGTWNQTGAIDAAQKRLDDALAILREEGLEADGNVGDMHPISAIRDALIVFPADLIVISTHPASRSRWLKRDVVEQARKRFKRPVRHVVSKVPEESTTV